MRDTAKAATTLLVICFCVALCLALVNNLTRETIKQKEKMNAKEQRRQVMHEAKEFMELENWKEKDESGIIREAYAAYDGQKLVGYVFSAFPKGYGGEIKVTVGVYYDRRISGVKVGENKETPGLGSKASESGFLGQYKGRSVQGAFKVVKHPPVADNEIQAISGATITSQAVTSAVQASAKLGEKLIEDGGT